MNKNPAPHEQTSNRNKVALPYDVYKGSTTQFDLQSLTSKVCTRDFTFFCEHIEQAAICFDKGRFFLSRDIFLAMIPCSDSRLPFFYKSFRAITFATIKI